MKPVRKNVMFLPEKDCKKRFCYAETEEEKEKVLQELLNNPNNKIVEMTPTEEPSKGGSTEAVDEGE